MSKTALAHVRSSLHAFSFPLAQLLVGTQATDRDAFLAESHRCTKEERRFVLQDNGHTVFSIGPVWTLNTARLSLKDY